MITLIESFSQELNTMGPYLFEMDSAPSGGTLNDRVTVLVSLVSLFAPAFNPKVKQIPKINLNANTVFLIVPVL